MRLLQRRGIRGRDVVQARKRYVQPKQIHSKLQRSNSTGLWTEFGGPNNIYSRKEMPNTAIAGPH